MTRNIRAFRLTGTAIDIETVARNRWQWERQLVDTMRASGYLPVLELDPILLQSYTGTGFEWELTIYGMYAGRARAQESEGWLKHKLIPRSKSGASLKHAVSG